jgi:hypothetical protein
MPWFGRTSRISLNMTTALARGSEALHDLQRSGQVRVVNPFS